MVETFLSSVLGVHKESMYIKTVSSLLTNIFTPSLTKVLFSNAKTSKYCDDEAVVKPASYGGEDLTEVVLSVSEVNIVMKQLGMCSVIDESEVMFFEKEYFEGLFREEEPCLEEIWEVFKVFDVNSDGFIDATELGRVLCKLGYLKQGLDVEMCKRMIRGFDRNNDGLLDFSDFLKFMETCLCKSQLSSKSS